jgi:hypothetical protein
VDGTDDDEDRGNKFESHGVEQVVCERSCEVEDTEDDEELEEVLEQFASCLPSLGRRPGEPVSTSLNFTRAPYPLHG